MSMSLIQGLYMLQETISNLLDGQRETILKAVSDSKVVEKSQVWEMGKESQKRVFGE